MIQFKSATPVWIKNKRTTPNYQAGFRCDFVASETSEYKLLVTGSTVYRIFLNGEFIGYGPARAGHGYLRYDELILNPKKGINRLAIEVAGYNCSSYYTMGIKSFLCAEVFENDESFAYTGKDFKGIGLKSLRATHVHRYAIQRAYGEVWNFDVDSDLYNWIVVDNLEYLPLMDCTVEEDFIPRGVPYPEYRIDNSSTIIEKGRLIHSPQEDFVVSRIFTDVSNRLDGFLESEFVCNPSREIFGEFVPDVIIPDNVCLEIFPDEYIMFSMEHNNTGFIINEITAHEDSEVYVFFSEYRYGGGMIFNQQKWGTINIIKYNLKKSDKPYKLESFEPYTFKYIGVVVTKGKITVGNPSIREYVYPLSDSAFFECKKMSLNKIYNASITTFAQNTLDILMDCPGRERGGWLCDGYFSAQSERLFSGESFAERNFLENFVMAKEFPNLDIGMLPMVYPADMLANEFIPQWSMWFFIELAHRSKYRNALTAEDYKDLAYGLLGWFEKYENSDGLLEHLSGWNLLEWSAAQDWFDDVNYPTNMLYYKTLNIISEMFDDYTLREKAVKLKENIIHQSYNGKFFVENAVRNNKGELVPTDNISETCQYFAYFCGIINFYDDEYKEHSDTVINVLGSNPLKKELYPDMVQSAAFIGNYMRLELMLGVGQFDIVIKDIENYFLQMADSTGTLWENANLIDGEYGGSLNHGFASSAGVYLVMACAGIKLLNYKDKVIFADKDYLCGFDYNINIKTPDGYIRISSEKGIKKIDLPEQWRIC